MQAIITKYLGPTNSRGSRIRATIQNNFSNTKRSVTIAYDSGTSERTNHARAAMALVRLTMNNIPNPWTCGELPNGQYCFVMQGENFSKDYDSALTEDARVKVEAA